MLPWSDRVTVRIYNLLMEAIKGWGEDFLPIVGEDRRHDGPFRPTPCLDTGRDGAAHIWSGSALRPVHGLVGAISRRASGSQRKLNEQVGPIGSPSV